MKSVRTILLLAATLSLAAFDIAQAGIVFTIEGPGVQSTTVAGAITETFDSLPIAPLAVYVSPNGGTYSGGGVVAAGVFGGAGGVGNYDLQGAGASTPQTLTFSSDKTYFGMWWSAGDAGNHLEFFDAADVSLGNFAIADIIPFLTPAYRGNPNGGGNPAEYYAYLNFTATGGDLIRKIVFSETTGGGFESDNHSTFDQPIDPPGNAIPEPATALFGFALMGFAGLHRRG
jgi:hypothetical protein